MKENLVYTLFMRPRLVYSSDRISAKKRILAGHPHLADINKKELTNPEDNSMRYNYAAGVTGPRM